MISLIHFIYLAAPVFATISNTNLFIKNNDPSIDGLYVTAKFENSILYFLLGNQADAVPISYDDQQMRSWVTTNNHNYYLQIDDNGLIIATQTDIASGQFVEMDLGPTQDKNVYIGGWNLYAKIGVDPAKTQQYTLLLSKYTADASTKSFPLSAEIVQYNGTANPTPSQSSASGGVPTTLTTSTQSATSQPTPTSNNNTTNTKSSSFNKLVFIALVAVPIIVLLMIYMIIRLTRRPRKTPITPLFIYPNQIPEPNPNENFSQVVYPPPIHQPEKLEKV